MVDIPSVEPEDIRNFRLENDLSLDQMADVMGYDGEHRKDQINRLEKGKRQPTAMFCLLFEAYRSGYRPPSWPEVGLTRIGTRR